MKRVRVPMFLGLLALSVASWAGPVDDPRAPAAPVVANGVYSVNFHVYGAAPVPSGTTLTCKAKVTPTLPGAPNPNTQPVVAIGSAIGCTLEIPYAWTVSQSSNAAAISYQVDAVSDSGTVVRSTSVRRVGVGLPPAGGTARVNVAVNF